MTMSADSGSKEEREKGENLWKLPRILSVKIIHVYYKTPVPYFMKSRPMEMQEAVEFLVKTSEDFPIRALSPALFVGDFPVTEGGRVNENLYQFVTPAPEIESLETGAPISIGWAGVKAKKIRTNFQYQVQYRRK